MPTREKRPNTTKVMNIDISAAVKQEVKIEASIQGRWMWEIVEDAIKDSLKTGGAPAKSDPEAAQSDLNVHIDAGLKMAIMIQSVENGQNLKYAVEDALIRYLSKTKERRKQRGVN